MKKLIGTAMLAALLATSAFAEINFGAWLRAVAAPVAGNGDDIVSGMTNSWGWGARVARINIDGTSEDGKVGFSMGVYNDAWGALEQGDNQVIWAKPWDFLRVSLGKWDYTAFRGDLAFGSWNWIRPQNWLFDDEGLTFDQLGNQTGIQLELTPVEGLVVMWNLPLDKGFNDAYKMFERQHIAAKYTIGDIGTIKAGWGGQGQRKYMNKGHDAGYGVVVGNKAYYYASREDYYDAMDALQDKFPSEGSDDDKLLKAGVNFSKENYFDAVDPSGERKYWGDVNVAFDLTAIENLYVTVGAKVSLAESGYKEALYRDAEKADGKCFKFIKVGLGASYQVLDNLKVSASFGLQTYQIEPDKDGVSATRKPDFQFGVGADFGLTDSLTLNADFRGLIKGDYEIDGKDQNENKTQFSFLVGVQYAISGNGYVGIGFQGTTNGNGFLPNGGQSNFAASKADSFCWAVPIAVSCWF